MNKAFILPIYKMKEQAWTNNTAENLIGAWG